MIMGNSRLGQCPGDEKTHSWGTLFNPQMCIPDYFFRSDENRTDPEDPERSTKSAGFSVTKAVLILGAAAAGSLLAASFWTSGSVGKRRRLPFVVDTELEGSKFVDCEHEYRYGAVFLYGMHANGMLREYTDNNGERFTLVERPRIEIKPNALGGVSQVLVKRLKDAGVKIKTRYKSGEVIIVKENVDVVRGILQTSRKLMKGKDYRDLKVDSFSLGFEFPLAYETTMGEGMEEKYENIFKRSRNDSWSTVKGIEELSGFYWRTDEYEEFRELKQNKYEETTSFLVVQPSTWKQLKIEVGTKGKTRQLKHADHAFYVEKVGSEFELRVWTTPSGEIPEAAYGGKLGRDHKELGIWESDFYIGNSKKPSEVVRDSDDWTIKTK